MILTIRWAVGTCIIKESLKKDIFIFIIGTGVSGVRMSLDDVGMWAES